VEPVLLYKHCSQVPWGLARLSSEGKVPETGPYKYKYNDAAAGQGVIAYVLDTGINDKHEQFEGRATKGPKFVTEPYPDRPDLVTSNNDKQGHGTHCAGTIGAKDYGVAKKVDIVGIKVFNDLPDKDLRAGATNADIMAAIQYVVQQYKEHGKPSVINLSLGGYPYEPLDAAVSAAVRAGVLVVCAAGNEAVCISRSQEDARFTNVVIITETRRDHLASAYPACHHRRRIRRQRPASKLEQLR
jgi:subtilisin family serine protease